MTRVLAAVAAFILYCAAAMGVASARGFHHDQNYVFQNLTIHAGEIYDGDVNVALGNVTVEEGGAVNGQLNVALGNVTLDDGARVGKLNVVLGACDVGPSAVVMTETNCFPGSPVHAVAPYVAAAPTVVPYGPQNYKVGLPFALGALVFVVFLLFPLRTKLALERVEKHPGTAAAVGTIAAVAMVPLSIVLLLSIIGIPLIPLAWVAIFVGSFIGQAAIALLLGRRLSELVMPRTTPSPLAALLLGLVVLCAAEALPFFGGVLVFLVWLVGLGAAILAFFRERNLGFIANTPIGSRIANP